MSIRFSTISNSATVQLATSVNPVNEGSSSVVTLTTTGIQNGQAIPYTISGVGITSDDIGEALTGNFVVQNGTATKTLNIAADLTTEGQETLTMSLGTQFNSTNVALTINDTSLTPASGDIYQDNNVLLMHFDGANNSTTFTDVKGHTFTRYGNVAISTSQSKFGGSSVLFDGDGDYMTTPNSSDFNINGGNFTIEGWFYPTAYKNENAVVSCGALNSNLHYYFVVGRTGGEIFFGAGNGAWGWAGQALTSGASVPLNAWTHVAVVRNGAALTIYKNGVSVYTNASFNFGVGGNTGYLHIGTYFGADPSYSFNGYMDELRITKGVARYTSNFTVPSAAFSDLKNENVDPFFNNVVLSLHMDGANNSTTFTDSSSTNKALTSDGAGAIISTAQYKYGTASGSFSGNRLATTQFLIANTNEDFTLEAWVRPSSFGSFNQIVYGGTVNSQFLIRDNRFEWYPLGIVSPATITLNAWYHIAISRTNNVVRIFVNGQSGTPVTQSSIAYGQFIGAANNKEMFYGYMDDLRITKGVGRYITNFTPPSRAFADNA